MALAFKHNKLPVTIHATGPDIASCPITFMEIAGGIVKVNPEVLGKGNTTTLALTSLGMTAKVVGDLTHLSSEAIKSRLEVIARQLGTRLIAHTVHSGFEHEVFVVTRTMPEPLPLSDRQIRILDLASRGYTSEGIYKEMGHTISAIRHQKEDMAALAGIRDISMPYLVMLGHASEILIANRVVIEESPRQISD